MQKLSCYFHFLIGNNRGSALVVAVVLAILMAIAGIGFLFVTTNSINNDSDAYTRDKAFYAAESGALILTKYLMSRKSANWPAPGVFPPTRIINGLNVILTLTINAKQATVKSEAQTTSGIPIKTVTIVVQND